MRFVALGKAEKIDIVWSYGLAVRTTRYRLLFTVYHRPEHDNTPSSGGAINARLRCPAYKITR